VREIALDTETTGLDPKSGHRIVEIGCVELVNHIPSGETYHRYCNPEREVPEEAYRVHGLNNQFLDEQPRFVEIADDFLTFIGDAPLVIHNAAFDMGFINAELAAAGRTPLPDSRARDTVAMARRKFPGARANLDALCQRFGIDVSHRELHGALKDARLLAEVYLELIGGRQPGLGLASHRGTVQGSGPTATVEGRHTVRDIRPHAPSADEEARHQIFLSKIEQAIWARV